MTKRFLTILFGLLLVFLGFYKIISAQDDITILRSKVNDIPVLIYIPTEITDYKPPAVFVAHGFAGSKNIMSSFALTLSHAGFTVITWDFNGHGANGNTISIENRSNSLLENVNMAFSIVDDLGLINNESYAILGHSMGSGVAIEFAHVNPNTKATIAVSPVGQSVSPDLPKNLLLMAGSLEQNFVHNAEELLTQAGGEGGNPSQGNARKLQIIPNVEHITILFSSRSHEEARTWLETTFGEQPNSNAYKENRFIWYIVGIMGFVIISNSLSSIRIDKDDLTRYSSRQLFVKILILILGAVGGTYILWLANRIGIEIQDIFNLLVGGYVILWFGICGVIYLFLFRLRLDIPNLKSILSGLIGFTLLWLGFGLLGRYIWMEWVLIPKRLILWPIFTLITLPWFIIFGELIKNSRIAGLIGWWLLQSGIVILGLILSIKLIPDLGFLILILPLVPVILGLHMIFTAPWGRGWSFGISGAMFLSWTLLAVFPLV